MLYDQSSSQHVYCFSVGSAEADDAPLEAVDLNEEPALVRLVTSRKDQRRTKGFLGLNLPSAY